ncbi:MAG: hypothetical protein ACETWB_03280, partial [Anaerolineae bacterium]
LGRLADRYKLGVSAFTAGLAMTALFLPGQMAVTRALRLILNVTPGILVGFGDMTRSIFFILAPLCTLLGFQFTLGSRLWAERGGTVGRAYVYESWGAGIGGALFSFVLVRIFNPFQIALGLGAVELAVGAWVLKRSSRGGSKSSFGGSCTPAAKWALLPLIGALLLAAVAWPLGRAWHQATLNWQLKDILFSRDSIYGRLAVVGRDSQRVFYENGLIMFETQGIFPEEVVHFPLLEHADPRSVLLIGGGASGDLREILKYPVDEVHYVELDPLVIEAARRYLPPVDKAALDDPRVTAAYMDGRLYVKRSERRFDVIIVDLPEPSTGQLNRFYTQEFFQEVKGILNEGGVFSLGLPSAENYLNPEFRRRNGSVYHTLLSVFPFVLVLPGDTNFFLASDGPLIDDHTILSQRLARRGIETSWVNAAYIEYLFTAGRFQRTRQDLERGGAGKLNRDLTPICYYYDLALWLSRFYSGLSELFYAASFLRLWWLAVPLVLVVALFRWKRGYAVPVITAFTGFAEMALEIVLLLAFQAFRGYIYHEVSLIYAAFMVGTALGGSAMNRLIAHPPDFLPRGRRLLATVQAVIVLYAALLPMILRGIAGWLFLDVVFLVLVSLAGMLGGMEFPLAVKLVKGEVGRVAGLIYGADLAGACLGAILASVLFIPVLGIPQTCYAVALLSVAGLALLL